MAAGAVKINLDLTDPQTMCQKQQSLGTGFRTNFSGTDAQIKRGNKSRVVFLSAAFCSERCTLNGARFRGVTMQLDVNVHL